MPDWDAFVAGHPAGHILQTTQWAALKRDFGWESEVVAPAGVQGGALILYRPLPLKLGCIAYVPRGPVVDWEDAGSVRAVLDAVEAAARRRRAWALWIEPESADTLAAQEQLAGRGLRPAPHTIQPARTICVDIAPPEAAILAAMKSKTRYNIRLAERQGVTVRQGTLADAATFYALMEQTHARDNFGIHSYEYYHRALELFLPTGQATLLLAEFEGQALAGLVIFALGTRAWYFYGASSNEHRNKMPAYAAQWAAIRWAKARGCTYYDLWGIPDADETTLEAEFAERNDGLWGVYRFKRGFGGAVTRYVGLWEKVFNPLYPLAARIQDARRKMQAAGRRTQDTLG